MTPHFTVLGRDISRFCVTFRWFKNPAKALFEVHLETLMLVKLVIVALVPRSVYL